MRAIRKNLSTAISSFRNHDFVVRLRYDHIFINNVRYWLNDKANDLVNDSLSHSKHASEQLVSAGLSNTPANDAHANHAHICPDFADHSVHSIPDISANVNGILSLILKLYTNKYDGSDGIPNSFLLRLSQW